MRLSSLVRLLSCIRRKHAPRDRSPDELDCTDLGVGSFGRPPVVDRGVAKEGPEGAGLEFRRIGARTQAEIGAEKGSKPELRRGPRHIQPPS